MTGKKLESTLDLDALERPNPPAPFVITLGGKVYTLVDAKAIPWGDLAEVGVGGKSYFTMAVPEPERDEFAAALGRLPSWKVDALSKAYSDHYALPDAPNADASPTS